MLQLLSLAPRLRKLLLKLMDVFSEGVVHGSEGPHPLLNFHKLGLKVFQRIVPFQFKAAILNSQFEIFFHGVFTSSSAADDPASLPEPSAGMRAACPPAMP